MARTNNLTNFLTDVAAAIKAKLGDQTDIPASQFDTKIGEIETGGTYQSKTINITTNGSQTITPDTGYDALSSVVINVQVPVKQLQSKNYEFTQNTHIVLSPETGYDGFSSIDLTINVPGSQINNQNKTITQNGQYTADSGYTGLGTVTVNVPQTGYDTSDATATAGDILKGKTAYIVGGKVTGTYTDAVTLYNDRQAMEQSTGHNEGDKCVVYGQVGGPWLETTSASVMNFNNNVTLQEEITTKSYSSFSAVDSGNDFYGNFMFSPTSIEFHTYIDGERQNVSYSSSDGLHYTKDSGPDTINIGFPVCCRYGWNDVITYILEGVSNIFDGIFQYRTNYVDKSKLVFQNLLTATITSSSCTINDVVPVGFNINQIKAICNKLRIDFGYSTTDDSHCPVLYLNTDNELCMLLTGAINTQYFPIYNTSTSNVVGIGCYGTQLNGTFNVYKVTDLASQQYELDQSYTGQIYYGSGSSARYYLPITDVKTVLMTYNPSQGGIYMNLIIQYYLGYMNSSTRANISGISTYYNVITGFVPVDSQLTLSSPNEILPGVVGLGTDGSVTGTDAIYNNLSTSKILDVALNLPSTIISPDDYSSYQSFGDIPTKYVMPASTSAMSFYKNTDLSVVRTKAMANMTIDDNVYPTIYDDGYTVYIWRHLKTQSQNIVVSLQKESNMSDTEYLIRVEDVSTSQHTIIVQQVVALVGSVHTGSNGGLNSLHVNSNGIFIGTYTTSNFVLTKYDLTTLSATTLDTVTSSGIAYNSCQLVSADNYLVYFVIGNSGRNVVAKVCNTANSVVTVLRNDTASRNLSGWARIYVINQPDWIYVCSKTDTSSAYMFKLIKFTKSNNSVTTVLNPSVSTSVDIYSKQLAVNNAYEDNNNIYVGGGIISKTSVSNYKNYSSAVINDVNGQRISEYSNISNVSSILYFNNSIYILCNGLFAKVSTMSYTLDGMYCRYVFNCSELYPLPTLFIARHSNSTDVTVCTMTVMPETFTLLNSTTYSFSIRSLSNYDTVLHTGDIATISPVIDGTSVDYDYGVLNGDMNNDASRNLGFVFGKITD